MEAGIQVLIDVEAQRIDFYEQESIECWYTAGQIQSILGLNKAALQKVIAKLQNIYNIELKSLRRGSARATEYSQIALDAIELLESGKFAELRRLVDKMPTAIDSDTQSSAIVFLDRHNEIAVKSSSAADNNLTQINSLKSGLLNNYRELGRTLGRQAAAEVRQGFTDEVRAGLANLQES